MKHFYFEKKLTPFKDCYSITFAHNSSIASRQKHTLHLNSNHIEIYVYISGDVDFIVDDKYYPLESGDILLINPNQMHVAVPKNVTEYERFYILLPTRAFEPLKHNPILTFLNRPKAASAKISLPPDRRKQATEILYKISNKLKNALTPTDELDAYSGIMEFLCLVEGNFGLPFEEAVSEKVFIHECIKDTLNYIGENSANIASVSEIAEHLHLSLPYLSSLFKKQVGINLSHYLQTKKIAIAKELLEKGYSVSYACYESGFSDSSYFIKIFKEHLGVTPNKYKQNLKKL